MWINGLEVRVNLLQWPPRTGNRQGDTSTWTCRRAAHGSRQFSYIVSPSGHSAQDASILLHRSGSRRRSAPGRSAGILQGMKVMRWATLLPSPAWSKRNACSALIGPPGASTYSCPPTRRVKDNGSKPHRRPQGQNYDVAPRLQRFPLRWAVHRSQEEPPWSAYDALVVPPASCFQTSAPLRCRANPVTGWGFSAKR